jgi:glycosyltransferase involved in cell wall biosynthesis
MVPPDEHVTVAIPVLDGGQLLERVLAAVQEQQVDRPVELLVADSGSTDGSPEVARRRGAQVIEVPPGEFSHGGTRNLLMERSAGSHVAFLTQDSVPADRHWLARLLEGFGLAEDVALAFGPYRPRPGASPMVRRELAEFFASFSPDGSPRLDRSDSASQGMGLGRRAFFTDANGCVSRAAWERVPFREVAYAEDQLLARDMLAAGYSKAYHPGAAVVHSHEYRPAELLRRSFDEWRALADVQGLKAPASPFRTGLTLQREVRSDVALVKREGAPLRSRLRTAMASIRHHGLRLVGAALGSRSDRLPAGLRGRLSLEGRE